MQNNEIEWKNVFVSVVTAFKCLPIKSNNNYNPNINYFRSIWFDSTRADLTSCFCFIFCRFRHKNDFLHSWNIVFFFGRQLTKKKHACNEVEQHAYKQNKNRRLVLLNSNAKPVKTVNHCEICPSNWHNYEICTLSLTLPLLPAPNVICSFKFPSETEWKKRTCDFKSARVYLRHKIRTFISC